MFNKYFKCPSSRKAGNACFPMTVFMPNLPICLDRNQLVAEDKHNC